MTTSSSTAPTLPALAERCNDRLHLVEPDPRDPKQERRAAAEGAGEALRAQAIREITMISEFQAEVFDGAMRRWVPGFAVHSEFPRPSAKALHATVLRRRGLPNEQIAELLHLKKDRVSLLAWRGEGFLMSVEGSTRHEEARLARRRRL